MLRSLCNIDSYRLVYARQFSGENIQQQHQNKSRSKNELGNLQQTQINVITQFPGIQSVFRRKHTATQQSK